MVRQLTAIMFTDMVGYTAQMHEDEAVAALNRDRQREVLEESISAKGGRILQFVGDGTLSVFQSAVAAVESAITIQERLRELDPPIRLRIGIHSGDVVHDENGVFGDGVNVASRIEGLGVAGAVLVSDKVYDEIKNQSQITTRGLGSFNLKNIKHPMKVYAITNGALAIPTESDLSSGRVTHTNSIAVLPFVNMSSDAENEFFSDGITEELINALARVNGLQVTARTSSFAFKNRLEDVREVAQKLSVTHVLEGSVRRSGKRVRVTAQLVSAANGFHLMSESYDGTLDDIFALQDEMAQKIVAQLAGHLGPVRTSSSTGAPRAPGSKSGGDARAYAEYLRGRSAFAKWTEEGAREAVGHYEWSVELDAGAAPAYAGLSTAYLFLGATGAMPPAQAFARAEETATTAIELDKSSGEAHSARAIVRFLWHRDWEGAYRAFQKALSLTPGSAEVHQQYGFYLRALGDTDTAVEEFRAAVQLDPLSLPLRLSYAEALTASGELGPAADELDAILQEAPSFRGAVEALGRTRLLGDDVEGALELFDSLPDLTGDAHDGAAFRGYALAMLGRHSEARDMLGLLEGRAIEVPGAVLSVDFALIYLGLGDLDRVFHHLDEAVDKNAGAVVFLATERPFADKLRGDERFERFIQRIGHPRLA